MAEHVTSALCRSLPWGGDRPAKSLWARIRGENTAGTAEWACTRLPDEKQVVSETFFMLKILFLGREEAHLRYEYNKLIVVSIIEIPRG